MHSGRQASARGVYTLFGSGARRAGVATGSVEACRRHPQCRDMEASPGVRWDQGWNQRGSHGVRAPDAGLALGHPNASTGHSRWQASDSPGGPEPTADDPGCS